MADQLKDQLKQMSEEFGIDEFALRVLYIAVLDHYRGTPLVADQRDDIFKATMLEWFERADDENDPAWSDETKNSGS